MTRSERVQAKRDARQVSLLVKGRAKAADWLGDDASPPLAELVASVAFHTNKSDVQALPAALRSEEFQRLGVGGTGTVRGLVALTERRLLVVQGQARGLAIREIRLADVTAVDYAQMGLSAKLTLHTGARSIRIDVLPESVCRGMADAIRDHLDARAASTMAPSATPPTTPPQPDPSCSDLT